MTPGVYINPGEVDESAELSRVKEFRKGENDGSEVEERNGVFGSCNRMRCSVWKNLICLVGMMDVALLVNNLFGQVGQVSLKGQDTEDSSLNPDIPQFPIPAVGGDSAMMEFRFYESLTGNFDE
ncbi:hypothetical protein E3N88_05300 [Mikania micrantha]|uniref:Uncharacterized protein n=1 Tax=Mikania micrantha TaxID=192012 RepID=A0A5N6PKK2_9ASTR|nr:hypothetical protein E3N88_05300 [Mikania micrantha]